MTTRSTTPTEFDELRPRLRTLLELHRIAGTDEERSRIASAFQEAFLATAWHVARDLIENGWAPGFEAPPAGGKRAGGGHLKLVDDEDAA
jgi:hypothetical protein